MRQRVARAPFDGGRTQNRITAAQVPRPLANFKIKPLGLKPSCKRNHEEKCLDPTALRIAYQVSDLSHVQLGATLQSLNVSMTNLSDRAYNQGKPSKARVSANVRVYRMECTVG